ncbi:S9 family peptidase [Hymenobacter arizonensis]|uniref:Dipeptidyl aminopeptidase/acylaminoacyl peptidase n=1 Tax=Hymenobacter arizonensis TaxID=1227077 RepID=A0A1I5X8X6_HYMAR|nr:S9 family peptidase [Hymenobacter arizonensis]SFQ28432.1 Dipeptidyl aminopeptidase/acylaminoacyl peptidase [Hymenobacter arizonensis]
MKIIALGLLCCLAANSASAQQGTEPIKVTDLLKIKQVGGITLSRDGRKAAFTVLGIEPDEKNKADYKNVSQLYLLGTEAGAKPRQLTSAREGATQPAWSPNGQQLAFVRTVDEKPQVFVMAADGGEGRQLTKYKHGASNPKWSPDGKQVLFSSAIPLRELLKDSLLNATKALPRWPFEKPGFDKNDQLAATTAKPNADGSLAELRAYLDKNEVDKKAKVLTKLNFQDERDVTAEQTFSQFFLIDAAQPEAKPVAITNGFYRFNQVDFTPDGKHLLLSADIDSLQHPDRSLENEIYLADRDGRRPRLLLGKENVSYSNPVISPSGKWLAFQMAPALGVDVPVLAMMPLNGTEKDVITIPFDRNKSNLTWSDDERYVYFVAQSNGGAPLYRANIKTRKVEKLTAADTGILSFGLAKNKVVYAQTGIANPSDLFVADASLKKAQRAGDFNDWVKTRRLSLPEKHTFVNDKGLTVEYWVMKPAGYQAGRKYPVVLEIHGGPSAMWGPGEASMWHEFQYYAAQGYGVVYSNPRGSGGYGQDFLRANIKDWGTGPSSDVLTALDKTVAEGWADPAKLTVTGGSYAGYLVAWIISHDQRFKAACSQRGVYDLATFFGEGNAWRLVPGYFGGYPWEPEVRAVLTRESPFTYVDKINTPYILFHGENDRRTGFVQSEMMYRSLKVLGRPVEYVRHPGGTHELTRAGDNRQRIDQMLRTYEFFERYINTKGEVN